MWLPSAGLATLRLRARLLCRIRRFFEQRGVLEVETPVLSMTGVTDPALSSFTTTYHGPGDRYGRTLYLQTSPEYHMKRLLAAGSGSIYQLARVFRDEEAGRLHNPEFTLLEWYRVDFDHHQLMDEVAALVVALCEASLGSLSVERLSYAELFGQYLGIDPHRTDPAELRDCARRNGIIPPPGLPMNDCDPWLDLLLTHCLEPHLGRFGRLSFVYDYPASQAALARIRPDDPPVAERFELYLEGVELANGFHELNDPHEQRCRFEQDNRRRRANGQVEVPMDECLLAALTELPPCSGVALGVDRLLLMIAGERRLARVLSFSFDAT